MNGRGGTAVAAAGSFLFWSFSVCVSYVLFLFIVVYKSLQVIFYFLARLMRLVDGYSLFTLIGLFPEGGSSNCAG